MIDEFLFKIKNSPYKKIKSIINNYCMFLYQSKESKVIDDYQKVIEIIEKIRLYAVEKKDESFANSTFILKIYIGLIKSYAYFLSNIKNNKYKDSWRSLQDCLDYLLVFSKYELSKNIEELFNYFEKIEGFYPYNVFCSIEAKFSNITCSICGKDILDPTCIHRKGNLYFGEMCNEIVNKIDRLDAVAMVFNPQDKRCIFEIPGIPNEKRFYSINKIKSLLIKPFTDFIKKTTENAIIENNEIKKMGHIELTPTIQIQIMLKYMYTKENNKWIN